MNQSQILGILLALATAIGCIVYEKLVKVIHCGTMLMIISGEVFLWSIGWFITTNGYQTFIQDIKYIGANTKLFWCLIIYALTGCTSLIWFNITKNQSVMVSSLYEIKYIAILTIMYLILGTQKISLNLIIGIAFALISLFFISKG